MTKQGPRPFGIDSSLAQRRAKRFSQSYRDVPKDYEERHPDPSGDFIAIFYWSSCLVFFVMGVVVGWVLL